MEYGFLTSYAYPCITIIDIIILHIPHTAHTYCIRLLFCTYDLLHTPIHDPVIGAQSSYEDEVTMYHNNRHNYTDYPHIPHIRRLLHI
jgi:hypothetical protein